MQLTLKQIADHIGGRVIGDPDAQVSGLGSLDNAVEGEIIFLANPKHADKVRSSRATAVIMPAGANCYGKNVIETKNPNLAYAKVLTLFHDQTTQIKGVMEGAFVSAEAALGRDVTIYPGVYIAAGVTIGDRVVLHPGVVIYEGASIGDDVTLHANVSIRERCRLGNRVIIHNGTVIGSDGFGYAPDGKKHFKIPQVGIVVIEDDVEIGANSTVDRATLDITRIGRGSKIDNLVQIGHNCTIGEDNVVVSQVGISGSTKTGRNVTIGGQAALAGQLEVGDNIILAGRAGVTNDMKEPGVFSGLPAIPHRDWLKSSIVFTKLPEMKNTVANLEKRIAELEKQIASRGQL
jgi:UDP-3-O-[3-hydroxymyristoyl] glucosamine N-acyltransferase